MTTTKRKFGVPKKKLLHLLQGIVFVAGVVFVTRKFLDVEDVVNAGVVEKAPERDFDFHDDTVEEENAAKSAADSHWNFNVNRKVDWSNEPDVEASDALRAGPGEGGRAYRIPGPKSDEESRLFGQHGFNAFISDQISVNRSVKDIRHEGCKSEMYSAELPTVSVVIPFINEHLNTLKRTFHSVINRSPERLLKEIILVDDFSDKSHVKKPLEDYIAASERLRSIVRIIRLPERGGLVRARQAGAEKATGDVLIFLDSHTEANYNWLPPLLEPIAEDFRTAVCPFIDVIDMNDFEYRAQDEGKRGSFDWELFYKRLDLLPSDLERPTKPFKSPVMAGGLFAISAKFFWEVGGYDQGILIWGGEQYELSFKIWQCGGSMVDAPCSRVGHIYRKFAPFSSGGKGNYLARNYKRVAEVWMDEYKEYLYQRRPHYRNVDAGNIDAQKSLRERLKCKSFKWFMETVAFDQPLNYPAVEPDDFASGRVESLAQFPKSRCLYAPAGGKTNFATAVCGSNKAEQEFVMNWHKDMRPKSRSSICLDVSKGGDRAPVEPYECHGGKGNQLWRYFPDKQMLLHGSMGRLETSGSRCLEIAESGKEVFVSPCDASKPFQRWRFERVDEKRLAEWDINKL